MYLFFQENMNANLMFDVCRKHDSKQGRQEIANRDVNHRKGVEIILNSENISRQQSQELGSFIR